jgi:hypothetical protein
MAHAMCSYEKYNARDHIRSYLSISIFITGRVSQFQG